MFFKELRLKMHKGGKLDPLCLRHGLPLGFMYYSITDQIIAQECEIGQLMFMGQ